METLKLIPWCATGLLTDDERAYIEEQLKQYPVLQEYLEEERELIKLVNEDRSLLDLSILEPTESRLEKVLENLDTPSISTPTPVNMEEEKPETASMGSASDNGGFFSRLPKLFFGVNDGKNRLYYASFASIVVFLGLLIAFVAPLFIDKLIDKPQTSFHPATVQTGEGVGQSSQTTLLLGLNGDIQNPWLVKFLKQNNANMTKIPGKDGLYRINFDKKLTASKIESLIKQLNNHNELIWFAGEAY